MNSAARDTFLHFLNDNLPSGVPLHPLRRDPNDRSADALQMNAVNVSFLNISAGNGTVLSSQQVVIDVINDDENTVADWASAVIDVLSTQFFAPMYSYSDPAAPAPLNTNLLWDRRRLTFKRISSDTYCHYSCLLVVKFSL